VFYLGLISFAAVFSLLGLAFFAMYVDRKTSEPGYTEE